MCESDIFLRPMADTADRFSCGHNACANCTIMLLMTDIPRCHECRWDLFHAPCYNLFMRQALERGARGVYASGRVMDVIEAQDVINSFYMYIK